MKISRKWLAEFVDGELPAASALAAVLTARGLEVETTSPFAPVRGPVVAARVSAVAPHPDPGAKKLRLCALDFGAKKTAAVVCGAPNVRAGITVALARPGAVLGENKIAARPVRGTVSEGVVCSAAELGVAAESDRAMELARIPPGQSLADPLLMNDDILEVAITPNRGDCLSHLGIAREVAAALNLKLKNPARPASAKSVPDIRETFPVAIDANARAACPYYGCVLIRGVDAAAPSPWRVRTLLERCGMRAVSAAVDATNYIAAAVGQPLHAFDASKLSGGIRVRFAKRNEKIKLLDDTVATCETTDLVIADHQTGAALAGVMGGANSAVSDSTRDILLEGAHFVPAVVRGRARRIGVASEAAFRFERGVDFAMPPVALALGAKMIRDACGGKAGPLAAAGKTPSARKPVSVSLSRVRDISGARDLSAKESASALNKLQLPTVVKVKKVNNAKGNRRDESDSLLTCRPPSWRFDLEIAEDLVEEILRARGYDKLPEEIPAGGRAFPLRAPSPYSERGARAFWAARGYREIVTYAFVPPSWESELRGERSPIALANPISEELSAMRGGLLGGLLDRARFNLRRGAERLRLFESGRCFFPRMSPAESGNGKANGDGREWSGLPLQELRLGGLALGGSPTRWDGDSRAADFYDLKGDVEEFLSGLAIAFAPLTDHPALHPGRAAAIVWKNDVDGTEDVPKTNNPRSRIGKGGGVGVGVVGELHPEIASRWEFRTPPLLFELDLSQLSSATGFPAARTFSRLPPARRDLAAIVAAEVPAGAALAVARRFVHSEFSGGGGGGSKNSGTGSGLVTDAELFDLHIGDPIPAGRKSLGLRLTLQGESQNLTEREIADAVDEVAAALRKELGAELRGGESA